MKANFLMGWILLIMGILQINQVLGHYWPNFYFRELILLGYYSIGAFFFLYTKQFLSLGITRIDLALAITPLLHLIIWYLFLRETYDDRSFFLDLNDLPSSAYNLLFAGYGLYLVYKNKDSVHKQNLRWNLFVLLLFMVMIISYMVYEIMLFFELEKWGYAFIVICYCSVMIFVYGMVYFSLKYPDLLISNEYLRFRIKGYPEEKYKSSLLPEVYRQSILKELKVLVRDEGYFKDADLSLSAISGKLNYSTRDISQTINTTLGKSFREYLNEIRIEYAASLLKSDPLQRVNEVMYASGFNSKSIFNRYFKERYGMTPTEYQRNYKT